MYITRILYLLFCIAVALCYSTETNGKTYVVAPDSRGRLDIFGDAAAIYKPGDIIHLKGKFISIFIDGLEGTSDQPIRISNYPNETVTVGDPAWNGGSYSFAVQISNCRYFIFGGENSPTDFIIDGSIQEARYAYFDLNLRPFADNAEVKNITIKNGGFGIVAKTDPDSSDPKTWHHNSRMNNLSIHDVKIIGTSNEGMYIGHTAVWWGWDEKGEGYNATDMPRNPTHKYVQPIKWNNVKIYNTYLKNIGCDGIQTATIDNLEIYGNEVTNWGTQEDANHSAGIQIGKRSTNTNTHDNHIHDGFGEMFQFQGSGEGNTRHTVRNNLLVNTRSNGMGIYGSDNACVQITNNTIIRCEGFSIMVNGRNIPMTTEHIIKDNVMIEAQNGSWSFNDVYIKTINGAKIKEIGNLRFDSVKKAKVDPDNSFRPLSDSTIGNAGYKNK